MKTPGFEFDPEKGRVVFIGDCLEMHAVCRAMCCRKGWSVLLSEEEGASGQFQSHVFCRLTARTCRDGIRVCTHRRIRLAKREDGGCVYLQGNRCGIYERRPRICREFRCTEGWVRARPISIGESTAIRGPFPSQEQKQAGYLDTEDVFVPNPLVKISAVFYLKHRREIVFVTESAGACGRFHSREPLDCPHLDDDLVTRLIRLFDRGEPLGRIYRLYRSETGDRLTEMELDAVVRLLLRKNILIDGVRSPGPADGGPDAG